ncbi:MAG: YlmC/YmxH family sporulation protein [Oscillospiraceae bacterium]|nr:YlmC/YmxH family sporulation protein [Oscillospiraceae bacterium]
MTEKLTELRCKEIINVCDGARLGFIRDMEIDTESGCICSIIVPERTGLRSIFFKCGEIIIPWNCISKIGEDLILVEIKNCRREHHNRREKKWKF